MDFTIFTDYSAHFYQAGPGSWTVIIIIRTFHYYYNYSLRNSIVNIKGESPKDFELKDMNRTEEEIEVSGLNLPRQTFSQTFKVSSSSGRQKI